ncbi:MAG: polysaccharide biosynthesis tyrosine autokinase [Bacteroidaceae bacterium]|nr:polysaccharide biosynthesis tyrosine autokinase [Bacteroidaceae bacterium]
MAEYIDNEKIKENEEESSFDFRKIWSMVILNWYWFIVSTLICVALAYVYLRYQRPVYAAETKVLIKDNDSRPRRYGNNFDLSEMGIMSNSNGFDNELEILGSAAIATKAVTAMKLYVTYNISGRVTDIELYKETPVVVDLEENHLAQLELPVPVKIQRKGNGYHVEITLPSKENPKEGEILERDLSKLPATINTKVGPIMLAENPGIKMPDRDLTAVIYPPITMGRFYARSLEINRSSKMTTVAILSLKDTKRERALEYLSQIIKSYNDDANEDKNEVANKTKAFIDERIDMIRHELDSTEYSLERYKRENEIINLPTNANQSLAQSTEMQKRQVEIQTQISLVNLLADFVGNPANCYEIIPANIGVDNQAINNVISEYNDKVLTRRRLLRSASEQSPSILQMTDDIRSIWDAIQQQLAGISNDLRVQKKSIDDQYALYSGKVNRTPSSERVLNGIGRQQEIKAGLYLTLLQKREENYISLASTAAKARIIDEPQFGGIVSPKSRIIMLLALILGLAAPLAIFYFLELIRFRIEGREDVEKVTNIPIVADIPLSDILDDGDRAIVVRENSNNIMEEVFRGLRTNLRFLLSPGEKVVCVTSTVPGEGKTFVATNLAMSLALLGKKVIIIGLDVRKPRLIQLFGLPASKKGITSYLVLDNPSLDVLKEQIYYGVGNKNLDVMPAGVIPPNPGELITRETLDQAIEQLKDIYDYIILDTPPVGLVSDTYELARVVDLTFFVCRSEYSAKADFDIINKAQAEGKLPKINLVLNGLNLKNKKYGFYYGYGSYRAYAKYGTYYGTYGHYDSYGHYGDHNKGKTSLED